VTSFAVAWICTQLPPHFSRARHGEGRTWLSSRGSFGWPVPRVDMHETLERGWRMKPRYWAALKVFQVLSALAVLELAALTHTLNQAPSLTAGTSFNSF